VRPYPFQWTGIAWLYGGRSILADEPGSGKTIQSLVALRALGSVGDVLVVTTNSMKYKWAEEAHRWSPSYGSVVVVNGSPAKRRKQIEDAPAGTLFVINWESLRLHTRVGGYGSIALSDKDKAPKEFNARDIAVIIADEAHKVKDPKSHQSRALSFLAKSANYVWALTGTPVSNEPNDLWALLHLMDPDVWSSRSKFQERYVYGWQADWGFVPTGWNPATKDELFRFVDQYMLRRSKAEVLPDLPAKTYETRVLDMTPKQLTIYKAMRKEMMANIEGELLITDNNLTKAMRLHQIASATPVLSADGEVVSLDNPSNKVAALLEILAEGGDEQVVVFALSRKLIDLAEQALDKEKITSVRVTGAEGSELRALHVAQFQEGQVRVVLCTFGAGSEGITLTAASTAVFLQRPWSLVQSRQAEDRIHRIGQDADKVLIIDLVSKGTIDVKVHEALTVKGEHLESVTRDRDRMAALLEGDL
jgi:SNF2 family DNA or RNA helicase